VVVRIRPLNQAEIDADDGECLNVERKDEHDQITLVKPTLPRKISQPRMSDGDLPQDSLVEKTFGFDRVYNTESTQEEVFAGIGKAPTEALVEGFNGCIFAYGQTGSGKSHSILGGPSNARGVLPRVGEMIFEITEAQMKKDHCVEYRITASYLELYQERAKDLLVAGKATERQNLDVRTHPKFGVYVPGLTETAVTTSEKFMELVSFGNKIRVVGATNMNDVSSRSHAVFTFTVVCFIKTPEGKTSTIRRARLHSVDLAGSERLSKSVTHEVAKSYTRFKEGVQINRSLSALGNVIQALAHNVSVPQAQWEFVPFRNSKLTYLLSDSLQGNCRTVMLANVSAGMSQMSETQSTLQFASNVKRIRTSPSKNEEQSTSMVSSLQSEIATLKDALQAAQKGSEAQYLEKERLDFLAAEQDRFLS
jgi:kinesin family protein 3/17